MQSSLQQEDRLEQSQYSPYRVVDFLKIVLAKRRFIVASTILAALLALACSYAIKKTYSATTVLLPPRQDQSVSALLAGSGGLGALGGGALGSMGLSLKNPNDVYISFLSSRTLTTALAQEFHLQDVFHTKTIGATVGELNRHTAVSLGRDNLISITVTTTDRSLSSRLANAYVDKLHGMNTLLAVDESAQRRAFYQQQLDEEKRSLTQAEATLQEIQARTGILQPSSQAETVSRNIANVRGQLTEREAEKRSLQVFDAADNPDYLQLNAQISSLQHELTTLESSNRSQTPGNVEIPTAQLPKAALEYARGLREVELHEQLYGLLVKQFEAAKIDEAKTAPVIQVIDPAIPPEQKTGPHRLVIMLSTGIVVLLLNLLWCAFVYVRGVLQREMAR